MTETPTTTTTTPEPPIDARVAAEMLGCSYQLVLKLYKTGQLKGFRVGKLVKFHRANVLAYMDANTQQACG